MWGQDKLLKRAVVSDRYEKPLTLDRFSREDRKNVAESMRRIAYCEVQKGNDRAGWGLLKESDRFAVCGCQFLNMACDKELMSFYIPVTCKSRVCPDCGRNLYGRMVGRTKEVIGQVLSKKRKGYFLTLVTLTFNKARYGDTLPDRQGIERAYRESSVFLRLFFGKYKSKLLDGKIVPVYKQVKSDTGRKKRVKVWRGGGFMAVMEVGEDNNNLHVHAVCYGHYESYTGMAAAWAKITGDSINVDFDPVSSPARAANYVLKYITKPPQTDSYNRLAAYAAMIKGTRRLRTGGIFYNALKPRKREKAAVKCPFCGGELGFKGYLLDSECVDKNRQAMLLPLLRDVKDSGKLIPSYSYRYSRALLGDLRN